MSEALKPCAHCGDVDCDCNCDDEDEEEENA